jgi:hypothetical protein
VTLHEAAALSLNIDPKQLRRASTRALMAGRQFDEGPEFEQRLALAKRCLGDTLPGPVNHMAVRYYDEPAAVRLRDFAAWAHSVEWQIPPELARVAAGGDQSGNATDPEPDERLTLPEQARLLARTMPEERAKARIEESMADAGEPQEVATECTVASHASGTRTTTDERVETACGEWIAVLKERPRNKETAFAEVKAAVAHIGALSYKAFDRAWANRAPGDWKKPGRPKKRPIV